MKVLALVLVAALSACKSDSKPAAKEAPAEPAAPSPHARAPGDHPALPGDEPAGDTNGPALPASDGKRRMDTDGDGVVSPEERAAARALRAQHMQEKLDANHDGKVTVEELTAAGSAHQGPRFADPKAVDTNNDGVISSEELQSAIQERREQWRARRGHDGDASPVGSDE